MHSNARAIVWVAVVVVVVTVAADIAVKSAQG